MNAGRRADRCLTAVTALVLAWGLGAAARSSAAAPETVSIALPMAVSFFVTDVNSPTAGAPAPTPVTFTNANLKNRQALDLSVKADSDFSSPGGGAAIPASRLSWNISSVSNGYGSNGTVSTSAFVPVFQSVDNPVAGAFALTWTLAAPGNGILAGTHVVTLRWKLDSIRP